MTRFAIPDFALANSMYIGARVYFYSVDVDGVKTDDLITLYDTLTGDDTLRNPQRLDGEGKFAVPVYVDEATIAVVSGLSIPDHETGVIRSLVGTPSLRYALVRPSADVVNPASPYTLICATSIHDDEDNHDGSTKHIIQAGQSAVRLRANAAFSNIAAGSGVSITIYKNGSATYDGVGKAASGDTHFVNPTLLAATAILEVEEDDEFTAVATSDDATFTIVAADSWFELEVIR